MQRIGRPVFVYAFIRVIVGVTVSLYPRFTYRITLPGWLWGYHINRIPPLDQFGNYEDIHLI